MLPTAEVFLFGVGFFKSLAMFVSKGRTLWVTTGSWPGFTLCLCHLYRLPFQICGQTAGRLAEIPPV